MKKLLTLLYLLVWTLVISAQTNKYPDWIKRLPKTPSQSNYYYRVTQGEGLDYDQAYAKAFARAILESSWKLGLEARTSDDLQAIEKGIIDNIMIESSRIILPLNKVCEYTEKLVDVRGVRIFILWQVAKYGNVTPNFDEYTDCE